MSTAAAPAMRPVGSWGKWLLALALALTAVGVGQRVYDHLRLAAEAPPLDPASLRAGYGPRDFAEALATANAKVAFWRRRVADRPGEWLMLQGLAEQLAARYRLSGDYADLAEADRLLDTAMAQAPWPSGPVLARAAMSLSVHKLDASEDALKRIDAWAVPPSAGEALDALSLRCEIALQRGKPRDATKICEEGDSAALRMREANIASKTGDAASARRILEQVLRKPGYSPDALAEIALLRSSIALESGDWQAAGRWARAADRIFPGYWLAEAYVAQQYALEGKLDEAAARYRAIAERTGNADVIDAYVLVLERQGRKAEAERWLARSNAAWQERMRLLPVAAAWHYAAHLFLYGDPREALVLAKQEYGRRPTSTSAVTYASALAGDGQVEAALAVLRDTESRGWKTAEMKMQESSLLRTLGRDGEAQSAWQAAEALNPHIADPAQRFVLFYQH